MVAQEREREREREREEMYVWKKNERESGRENN
jgi:hypothetical protein